MKAKRSSAKLEEALRALLDKPFASRDILLTLGYKEAALLRTWAVARYNKWSITELMNSLVKGHARVWNYPPIPVEKSH